MPGDPRRARWIRLDELAGRLGEIDADQLMVTGCPSGQMAELLADRGVRAENLDGGMQARAQAGLPLQTRNDEQPGKVA